MELYELVNKKGGGELIRLMEEASCNHDYSMLDEEIRNIRKYLYADGDGQLVDISELIEYRQIWRNIKRSIWEYLNRISRTKNNWIIQRRIREYRNCKSKRKNQDSVKQREICWKLDERGVNGETILHLCFLNPTQTHKELAKRMLDIYPLLVKDIYNSDTCYGHNVLHMAIGNEDSEMVKFVLDKGADCRDRACGLFFFPDDQKWSRTDDPAGEWITVLTETNYKGNMYFGEYPLSFAVSLHNPCSDKSDYISWILEKDKETKLDEPPLINLQDSNGNTALHMAVIHDKKELLQQLMDEGADLSIKNKQELTPLTLAAKLARKEMFDSILELEKTESWRFGDISCAEYPLEDFDTISKGGKINHNSALYLIVNGKEQSHINMMDGLVKSILKTKWKMYIRNRFYMRCILFGIYYLMAAFAIGLRPGKDYCLDRTVPVNPDYCNRSEFNISANSCYLYKPYRTKDTIRIILEAFVWFSALVYLVGGMIRINTLAEFGRSLIRIVLEVLVWFSVLKFLIGAIKRRRHQKVAGFIRSLRNPRSFLFYFACRMVVVVMLPLRFSCQPIDEDYVGIFVILLTTIYFSFLFQGFKQMGPYFVMVSKMVRQDVYRFALIYGIFLFGFSQAMLLVFRRTDTDNQFQTLGEALMGMFIMSVGKFEDIFETFKDSKHEIIGKIVFVVYMLLVTLLLINMLIAMMTNTYDKIASTKREWFRHWARIVLILEENVCYAKRLEFQEKYSQKGDNSRLVFVDRCRQSLKSS